MENKPKNQSNLMIQKLQKGYRYNCNITKKPNANYKIGIKGFPTNLGATINLDNLISAIKNNKEVAEIILNELEDLKVQKQIIEQEEVLEEIEIEQEEKILPPIQEESIEEEKETKVIKEKQNKK